MPDPTSLLTQIGRNLRWLVAATVVLYIALGGIAVWTYNEANSNGEALCALRGDLEKRVESSERFLVEHPNGIPGISARMIREGIENQSRTIEALDDLSC